MVCHYLLGGFVASTSLPHRMLSYLRNIFQEFSAVFEYHCADAIIQSFDRLNEEKLHAAQNCERS